MEHNKQAQALVNTISNLYEKISKLPDLRPSDDVNRLFTQLVLACIPTISIDVSKLTPEDQNMRSHLISICSEAEGLLESHYSDILASYDNPLDHLNIFPYYSNYILLSQLEYKLLSNHVTRPLKTVAFIGSGPLPLSSIVLAVQHMNTAQLHNYDISPAANARASKLLRGAHEDLGERMEFRTTDIMDVTAALGDYDVVFLAALVGMNKEEKVRVIEHLGKYMAPGALLVTRSAHGARAFLYPIIEDEDMKGFDVLDVYHPCDEVINSVIVARKPHSGANGVGLDVGVMRTCKCCEMVQGLNHLGHGSMMEEVALEELQS